MGACSSKPTTSSTANNHTKPTGNSRLPRGGVEREVATSNAIDRELDRAREQENLKVKLLLLGTEESGKSTMMKQMRMQHGSPMTDDERRMYGVIVRSNIVTAVRKLCLRLRDLQLEEQLNNEKPSSDSKEMMMTPKEAYDILIGRLVDGTIPKMEENTIDNEDWVGYSVQAGTGPNEDAQLFLQLCRPMTVLWQSKTMKEVWQKRATTNIIDEHKYYLQDMVRIASPKFCPTTKDILLAHIVQTTTSTTTTSTANTTQGGMIRMEKFRVDGLDFEMYNVGDGGGGQEHSSDCHKWMMDYFDNVDAVIFVAALSDYDEWLDHDDEAGTTTAKQKQRTNRMVKSLELFRSVCTNRAFSNTSIVLFLNKKDIFAEKILYSDIKAQKPFEDYEDSPRDFNSGVLYFIQKFKDCAINDVFNDSFLHVTCATDTNHSEFILDSIRTIIMTENLRREGYLGKQD